MDLTSFQGWYASLPPVTKYVATATLGVSVLTTVGAIHPTLLHFDVFLILYRFHVWRVFTNILLLGSISFPWLFQMLLWTNVSGRLEANQLFTHKGSGAYLWFIMLQLITLCLLGVLIYWPTGLPVLNRPLTFAIITYWSRHEPYAAFNINFLNVHGYQLPYVMLIFQILTGGSLFEGLMGVITGHAYYVLRDVLPRREGWVDFLSKPPSFLNDFMDGLQNFAGSAGGVAAGVGREASSQGGMGGGRSWFTGGGSENPTGNLMNRNRVTEQRTFSGQGRRLGEG